MILPDVLQHELKVVFCGTAAGAASVKRGAYYAGPGNRFWPTLHKSGLTPRLFRPEEYVLLPDHGIGLTDLCKSVFGNDNSLKAEDYDVAAFRARIMEHSPKLVAFNGLAAARIVLGESRLQAGPFTERIGTSRIHILPSTSRTAGASWHETHWLELAAMVRRL